MDHLEYLTLSQLIERRIAWQTFNLQKEDEVSLLWVPGFRSTMSGEKVSYIKTYCEKNSLGLTLFDYTAHGNSSGDFVKSSISVWLDDLKNIISQVTKGPIILVASSMGGWLSLLALQQFSNQQLELSQRIKGLVTIAPAIDLTKQVLPQRFTDQMLLDLKNNGLVMCPSRYEDESYPITQQMLDDGDQYLLLDRPFNLPCPLRILHGLCDDDVPYQGSVSFIDQIRPLEANAHLTLIKDGEHRLSRPQDLALLAQKVDEVRKLHDDTKSR